MTTVLDLLEDTRRQLLGSHRVELNLLSGAVLATDPTVSFTYPLAGITANTYLGIDDEIMFVWVAAGGTATVQRGMLGTTPAAHSANTLVEINPRFPRFSVRYALQEEIRSWGPQLFAVKTVQLAGAAKVNGYDLGNLGTFYSILDVTRESTVGTGLTNPLTQPRIRWRLVRNAATVDFPSGQALILGESFYTPPYPLITVTYAAPFSVDVFTDPTDVVATVGVDKNWLDIPALGATWRLLVTREVLRTAPESQGMPADLALVPVGSTQRAGMGFKALRDSRIKDAIWQLRGQYPIVRS